jgi:hypothetical protein
MGQNTYQNVKDARSGANNEIASLVLSGLPSPELRPIATVIYQTGAYGNTVNAKIVTTDDGSNYVDWRSNELPRGVPPSDHGSLTGLSDDDHTIYALADQSRGFSDFSDTVTFTSTEGLNTVTILNGLITNWVQE